MIAESAIKLILAALFLSIAYLLLSKGIPLCKDNPLKHNEKRLCYMIGD